MTVSQKLLILLWCVEGNVKFQLEVSENKDIYIFIQLHRPLQDLSENPGESVDPRLASPALNVKCEVMVTNTLFRVVDLGQGSA